MNGNNFNFDEEIINGGDTFESKSTGGEVLNNEG